MLRYAFLAVSLLLTSTPANALSRKNGQVRQAVNENAHRFLRRLPFRVAKPMVRLRQVRALGGKSHELFVAAEILGKGRGTGRRVMFTNSFFARPDGEGPKQTSLRSSNPELGNEWRLVTASEK
jgi:hypothetical protein